MKTYVIMKNKEGKKLKREKKKKKENISSLIFHFQL